MTDRELLERAAKAAGIEVVIPKNGGVIVAVIPGIGARVWNPLDDDGDALRLAVKLEFIIGQYMPRVVVWIRFEEESQTVQELSAHNGDRLAATRRAIVQAAASLVTG